MHHENITQLLVFCNCSFLLSFVEDIFDIAENKEETQTYNKENHRKFLVKKKSPEWNTKKSARI